MNTNYFRITAYSPSEDITAVLDCNGKFEKLWQFSSYLLQFGLKVIEVSTGEKFLDITDDDRAEPNADKLFLRSYYKGEHKKLTYEINGTIYNALQIGELIYAPDKTNTL